MKFIGRVGVAQGGDMDLPYFAPFFHPHNAQLSTGSNSLLLFSRQHHCNANRIDLGARARASGSEREMGRARASEIFPVSERQYI